MMSFYNDATSAFRSVNSALDAFDSVDSFGIGYDVMLSLGGVKFSITTLAYQSLSKIHEWKWANIEQYGHIDSLHFTGKENPKISLNGVIYSDFESVGNGQIDKLVALGDQGKPFLLASGIGDVLGYWVVLSVNEEQVSFKKNGSARKQNFTVELKYYGQSL